MILRQVLNEDLGCASYLVGDPEHGDAAVVDPQLDTAPYIALLERTGLTLRWILQTHTHADHVSGHAELLRRTGARLGLPRAAGWAAAHTPIDDGDTVELGRVALTAVATPGHRPEHTAYLVTDRARGDQPWAILTGDSLLVGDVARPDLATEATAGADELYTSLHERLLSLPDACELWPGHVAGSLCGSTHLSGKPVSTVAFERAYNPLLLHDRDAFVEVLAESLPIRPPQVDVVVALNRADEAPPAAVAAPLSAAQVRRLQIAGATVVDTRPAREFCAGHVPGAYAVPAQRSGLGSRIAQVADAYQPIIVVASSDLEAIDAIGRTRAAGCLNTAGWLDGGQRSWCASGEPTARLRTASVGRLGPPGASTVVDVREANEFARDHLPDSMNLPLSRLRQTAAPAGPLTVICTTGRRALTGASVLAARGSQVTAVVDGGVADIASGTSA